MSGKYNKFINKYNKLSSTIPKSFESFLWKKIELHFNLFQKKIYAAKKEKSKKTSKIHL